MPKSNKLFFLPIIIGILNFLIIISSDIYTPALPEISQFFYISEHTAAMTIMLYLFMLGTAGLFFGPLSDHIGRKKVVIFLSFCFFVGSLICSFAENFSHLILGRIIQGIGASIIPLNIATLRDHFQGSQFSAKFSLVSMIYAIAPIIGPVLGGVIIEHYSWRYNFYTIVLLSLVTIFINIKLFPRTPTQKNKPDKLIQSYANYLPLITNKNFITFTLISALNYCWLWIELCNMPFIMVNEMDYTPKYFGIYVTLGVLNFLLGAFINQRYVERFSLRKMLFIGISLILLDQIIILMISYFTFINPFILQILKIPTGIGMAFITANASALALSESTNKIGAGASIIAFFQLAISAIGVWLTTLFYNGTIIPLILAAIICNFINMFLFRQSKT